MTSQEVEIWAREIIGAVLDGSKSEDSKVEIKSELPTPEKAARQLAAHANAARGQSILWLIGIDEKARPLTDVQMTEMSDWWAGVSARFDGFPPRLEEDVNFIFDDKKLVALHFATSQEAPYVVRHKESGSFPEFDVPWREGTRVRAARRDELLRILVPKQNLARLRTELEFNLRVPTIGRAVTSFRMKEFNNAMSDGTMESLVEDLRKKITDAYIHMEYANSLVTSALHIAPNQDFYPGAAVQLAGEAVNKAVPFIRTAYDALSSI